MTTLERVARAICRERDPDDVAGGPHPMGQWLDEGEPWWTGYTDTVRAVLTAIREPSQNMQVAAFHQKVSFRSDSGMSDVGQVSVEYEGEPDKGAATLWRAMIDAMLEEG